MDAQDRERLTKGLRRMFHEATDEELTDALKHAGIDPKELAARGRAAGQRALAAVGEDTEEVLELHRCLGALLRLLRCRDGLSIEQLADRARVDPKELETIESDPEFEPNPRTIVQLEKHFGLKSRSLVLLSGAVTVDDDIRDEAVRFAANSESISKLDRKQKRMVNDFVRFLRDHTDG